MTTNTKLSSSYSLALDLALDGGLDLHLADLGGAVSDPKDTPSRDKRTADTTGEVSAPALDAIKSSARLKKWSLYDEDESKDGIYGAFESLVTPCGGKSGVGEPRGTFNFETPSRGLGRDETQKLTSWLLNEDDLSVGQKRKSEDFMIPPCSPLAQSFRKEPSLVSSRISATATRLGFSHELNGIRKNSKNRPRPSSLVSDIAKPGSKIEPLFGSRAYRTTDIDIRPSPSTFQCLDENPSESPFLSEPGIFPPTETRAIPPSLVHPPTDEGRSEGIRGRETGATGTDDLYGLGSFDQVFITDQDLDRAREKLPEEEIMSPEETMHALLQKLIEAGSGKSAPKVDNTEKMDATEPDKIMIFEDVSIGCNWATLGRGALQVERDTGTLRWSGSLVRIEDTAQPCMNGDGEISEGSLNVTLVFSGRRLLDVRSKHVKGERPRVIVTVRTDGLADVFVQFEFPNDQESQTNLCAEIVSCRLMDRTQIEGVVQNLRVSDPDEVSPDMDDIEEPAEMSDDATEEEAHRESIRDACAQRDEKILEAKRECEERIRKLEADRVVLRNRRRKERETNQREKRAERSKVGNGTTLVDDVGISDGSKPETKSSNVNTNNQTNDGVPCECQLCFTDEESQVLIPCGHRVCATCAVKLKEVTTKCPWDRVEYTKIDLICQQ